MDEQKLNEKLAKWHGFKQERIVISSAGIDRPDGDWVSPNGEYGELTPPDFTKSLDACFKWLVSKILERYDITLYTDDGYYFAWIRENCSEKIIVDSVVGQLEPAPALCLAIERLIDTGGS